MEEIFDEVNESDEVIGASCVACHGVLVDEYRATGMARAVERKFAGCTRCCAEAALDGARVLAIVVIGWRDPETSPELAFCNTGGTHAWRDSHW